MSNPFVKWKLHPELLITGVLCSVYQLLSVAVEISNESVELNDFTNALTLFGLFFLASFIVKEK